MRRQHGFTMDDGLRTITEFVVQNQKEGVVTIGVAGGSCSGKSYLCDKLSFALAELRIEHTVLRLDDYFRDIGDPLLPTGDFGEVLFDAPDSYCQEDVLRHLTSLIAGKPVEGPIYNTAWNQRVPGKTVRKEPTHVILIDGLFAIDILEKVDANKMCIYVDASSSIRLARRIERETRKYKVDPELSKLVFQNTVEPAHQRFVEPQRSLADLIISGEH